MRNKTDRRTPRKRAIQRAIAALTAFAVSATGAITLAATASAATWTDIPEPWSQADSTFVLGNAAPNLNYRTDPGNAYVNLRSNTEILDESDLPRQVTLSYNFALNLDSSRWSANFYRFNGSYQLFGGDGADWTLVGTPVCEAPLTAASAGVLDYSCEATFDVSEPTGGLLDGGGGGDYYFLLSPAMSFELQSSPNGISSWSSAGTGLAPSQSFRVNVASTDPDPDPVDPVLTAELFVTEAEQYETVTVTPEDLFTGCALDGVVEDCAADRAYFVSVPSGATTTTRGDGSEVMEYIGFEAGDYSFQFVIWDSVLGVYSAPQQGIIRISAMPGFLGVAEAPSKSFSIVAGETITITHDMLGDVFATAFEGDEPVFIEPWMTDRDGNPYPGWTVVYLDSPEPEQVVVRPTPPGMNGEPISELVFTSNTPGVYYFTYRLEINSKGYGFVTPPITSIITVTAEVPELPKVTG